MTVTGGWGDEYTMDKEGWKIRCEQREIPHCARQNVKF